MKKGLGLLLFLLAFNVVSQSPDYNKIQCYDSLFESGLNEGKFPGLSASYYSSDTTWSAAYGLKEWGQDQKVDTKSFFQLGSVGKVLTSIAVLQLIEDGRLSLEEDISSYLDFELDRFKNEKISLKDLLTHSAGMNDRNIGYLVMDRSLLTSLEEHLRQNLPSFFQSPVVEINYSNYSYALAGYIVSKVSNIPFQEYVKNHIFDPLEMTDSFVGFDFDYNNDSTYAKGHIKTNDEFQLIQEYARNALPAGSFISNAEDLGKLLKAFVNRDSILLNQESWSKLFERQFSNHPLLGGYSLGLEEQLVNQQTYWAKGGMLSGYLSQIVFWPDSTAMFIAINSSDDEFLEQFHSTINQKFFSIERNVASKYLQTDLSKYAGEYRNARYDREGVENIISLFRGAFNVWAGDSSILAWHNGAMQNYDFIGNHTFENRNDSNQKMVFVEQNGRIVKLYRNVNIGGLNVPSTFEKTSWYNSPTFINEYYGIIPLSIGVYGLIALFALIIRIIRKWKPDFWKWRLLPLSYYALAIFGALAIFIQAGKVFLPMFGRVRELLFGLSEEFILYNKLSYAIIIITIVLWIFSIRSLVKGEGKLVSRAFFFLLAILMSIHSWFLIYWNFV